MDKCKASSLTGYTGLPSEKGIPLMNCVSECIEVSLLQMGLWKNQYRIRENKAIAELVEKIHNEHPTRDIAA